MDLSFSEQLLKVVFFNFLWTKNCSVFNFESNTERGFIESLTIALEPAESEFFRLRAALSSLISPSLCRS